MDEFTKNEKLLMAAMFKRAADVFSNHGCNNLDSETESLLTSEEWDKMTSEIYGEEVSDSTPADYDIMYYFDEKLRKSCE